MKKIITGMIALAILTLTTATAQVDYNKWSLGLNVGGHHATMPAALSTRTAKISHYGINGRYMFNSRYGLMLDGGFDHFLHFEKLGQEAGEMKTGYARTSIQGVVNIGDILHFSTWTKHIGFLVHGGFGVSSMANYKETRDLYNIEKKQDWMGNLIFGITPQFKIGERVSLNADFSYVTNINQDLDYSMLRKVSAAPFKNQFINWSIGATFYLGKNAVHADWK